MGKFKRKSCYAVARGRTVGIYRTWEECEAQVKGYPGAVFKGFATTQEAQQFIHRNASAGPSAPSSFARVRVKMEPGTAVVPNYSNRAHTTRNGYAGRDDLSERLPPAAKRARYEDSAFEYSRVKKEEEEEEEELIDELNAEQQHALNLAESGYSLFLTGGAGTGKSFLLGHIVKRLRRLHAHPDAVAVTASTGVAACNIGGMTLHRWTGIGLGDESMEVMLGRAFGKRDQWRLAQVLIIDEISMISAELFDTIEYIARRVRNWYNDPAKERPFGGLQVICCGDFFQLPPVVDNILRGRRDDADDGNVFAFNAESWPLCIDL